jgi:hypothetical protein
MKKKNREHESTVRKLCRQERAEKKAIKVFNAELQKAIDAVDWGKVKLPRQFC